MFQQATLNSWAHTGFTLEAAAYRAWNRRETIKFRSNSACCPLQCSTSSRIADRYRIAIMPLLPFFNWCRSERAARRCRFASHSASRRRRSSSWSQPGQATKRLAKIAAFGIGRQKNIIGNDPNWMVSLFFVSFFLLTSRHSFICSFCGKFLLFFGNC